MCFLTKGMTSISNDWQSVLKLSVIIYGSGINILQKKNLITAIILYAKRLIVDATGSDATHKAEVIKNFITIIDYCQ